tara:strand:- start:1292 stop:1561 length:270 start_codon:yes stop_codon:yes gene_type:complete
MNAYQQLYSNVGGCDMSHMFDKAARKECERLYLQGKNQESQAELTLAQAALAQATKEDKSLSATQIAAIIGASLLGITLMVVIIKRTRK